MTGDYGFRFSSYSGSSDGSFDQYLISPELTKAGLLEFAYRSSSGTTDKFRVGYSSTTNDVSAFTWGNEMASASSWNTFSETMPENAKYFAINYTAVYQFRLYIDDITIYEMEPAGEWTPTTPISTTEKSCQISGLNAGTKYDVQIQGVCDNVAGNWGTASFTTVPYRTFTTEGDWNTASNWTPSGLPGENDDVAIAAAATIPVNYTAKVDEITMLNGGSITLANSGYTNTSSGQLWHNNDGVEATVNIRVYGYSTGTQNRDDYYLIASPFAGNFTIDGTSIVNTENEFDLYMFDQNENKEEWRNYEANPQPFNTLVNGKGYLYANSKSGWNNFTLTGTLQPSNTDQEVSLSYVEGKPFTGWNLVGNPFACSAYILDNNGNVPYYEMNSNGNGFVAVSNGAAIAPLNGVFVQATAEDQNIRFTRNAPTSGAKGGMLNVNLSQDNHFADNAIIRFDGGSTLEKFTFRANSSKVFVSENNKDYAVVNAGHVGEVPVSFKAEKNGSYTFSFSNENVEFGYLHLIDNMTGDDIDLLANPTYSFDALTTDYATRFKLVFATGNADDSFAFYSNGSFIISNDGNAMLQVVDVTGRILKSESINGCASVNVDAAPGVYMLRLINGDNMKVQKVVVK
jgi:hypothetical protein